MKKKSKNGKKIKTLTFWDRVARGLKRFLSPCRKK
tara:strand:- start:1106 stop:1210 length:105 start_codon:yes stop_codon:yes gene_type:complete